jgi:hypothetical protein
VTKEDRFRAAVHEAGHAFTMLLAYGPGAVLEIWLQGVNRRETVPNFDRTRPLISWANGPPVSVSGKPTDQEMLDAYAVAAVAGMVATHLGFGEELDLTGLDVDLENLRGLASALGRPIQVPTREDLNSPPFSEWIEMAKSILTQRIGYLKDLATELEAKRHLPGKSVEPFVFRNKE